MNTFKKIAALAAVGAALAAPSVFAQSYVGNGYIDSMSVEYGSGPQQRMGRIAVQSNWDKRWFEGNGRHLSGYWEGNLGLWRLNSYENVRGRNKNIGVIGFTPVLRYQNDSKLGLYGEIGIGVNLLSTLYKNENDEMSTAFQFGDHIGIGYTTAKWDFGLKYQHYSNASIKSPNAGANWVVAKAAYRF